MRSLLDAPFSAAPERPWDVEADRLRARVDLVRPSTAVRDLTVSGRVLRDLLRMLEKCGASVAELTCVAQLDVGPPGAEDARIDRDLLDGLIEVALDLTNDPALGLRCAEQFGEHMFVPLSYLTMHAATLRDALEALVRFQRLFSDDPAFRLVDCDEQIMVECLPRVGQSLRVERFVSELMVAGLVRLVRTFAPSAPMVASFAYAAPSHRAEYARTFDGAERFERGQTGVVFARALLDAPAPHRDEEIHAALYQVAEQRLMRMLQRTSYGLRVREHLIGQYEAQQSADMSTVARALSVGERSLRRYLAREQTTYDTVARQALAIVAKRLLGQQRTIKDVSHALGFSSVAAFHRAFKRLTGTTPRAYRAAQLDHTTRR